MAIRIIAYVLVAAALILNFVIPAILKKRGKTGTKAVVRVKSAALVLAVAALIIVLFFLR